MPWEEGVRMNEEVKPIPAPLVVSGDRTGEEPASPLYTASPETRREHDLLGGAAVPAPAPWGIPTQGAGKTFPSPGRPSGHFRDLGKALAVGTLAAARPNKRPAPP